MKAARIVAALAAAFFLLPLRAQATPIFAERYGFKCTVCHTAVPELNAFGEHFRRAGFRIPNVPQRGVVPIAVRIQEDYTKNVPPADSRRFNALAIAFSTANFGPHLEDSYFVRYFFGAQTAPGSLYYAYVQHVAPSNGDFIRLGEYSLPTIASPTQRLDTFTAQPVYTESVGQSTANFATPRWGVNFGQRNDHVDAEASIAFDEYHGAAYGAPAPPSELAESFGRPELFGSYTYSWDDGLSLGGLGLDGKRDFVSRATGASYSDVFYREGIQGMWVSPDKRWNLLGQQIWGHDDDVDGFGTAAKFYGGFLTLKYRPTHNSYLGVRYDGAANPFAVRDLDYYAVWAPTIHARLVLEELRPLGTHNIGANTDVQLLIGLPFENGGL